MMLRHASDALQRGWHIFPTEPFDKQPAFDVDNPGWRLKWGEVATNDVGQIVKWWTGPYLNSNVGVSCKLSGLLVVDCDIPKKSVYKILTDTPYQSLLDEYVGVVEGYDVFRAMCLRSGGDWERTRKTLTVATGSGGCHFYYRWPPEVKASQASLMRDILDVRCNGGKDGGYVLGPGSRTQKGFYAIEDELPIIDCPDWLIERCREKPRQAAAPARSGRFAQPSAHAGHYEGLLDKVRYMPEGNRNFVLYWAARTMAEEGVPLHTALEWLVPAAEIAGLHHTDSAATIRSGYRAQGR